MLLQFEERLCERPVILGASDPCCAECVGTKLVNTLDSYTGTCRIEQSGVNCVGSNARPNPCFTSSHSATIPKYHFNPSPIVNFTDIRNYEPYTAKTSSQLPPCLAFWQPDHRMHVVPVSKSLHATCHINPPWRSACHSIWSTTATSVLVRCRVYHTASAVYNARDWSAPISLVFQKGPGHLPRGRFSTPIPHRSPEALVSYLL